MGIDKEEDKDVGLTETLAVEEVKGEGGTSLLCPEVSRVKVDIKNPKIRRMLELVAMGYSDKEVAEQVGYTEQYIFKLRKYNPIVVNELARIEPGLRKIRDAERRMVIARKMKEKGADRAEDNSELIDWVKIDQKESLLGGDRSGLRPAPLLINIQTGGESADVKVISAEDGNGKGEKE